MVQLKIKESNDDLPIIKRLKKSLIKKFKPSKSSDIDKAVILANFLFALDKTEESADLLDSFIHSVDYDSVSMHAWGSNGQGVILRAYIHQKIGTPFNDLISMIAENDFVSDRASRYKYYLEDLYYHNQHMDAAKTETQKHRAEGIGQEALSFLYLLMMLPFDDKNEAPVNHKDDLMVIIDDCYAKLKETLLNPKQERMSDDEYEEKYKGFKLYDDPDEIEFSLKDAEQLENTLIRILTEIQDKESEGGG